ncbi:MAG TPA: hypothetical protein VFU37_19945 [Pyrinomonadaceae bacterium]|nr:hypothetical protein [Pyrinomonadaceae bacterium]
MKRTLLAVGIAVLLSLMFVPHGVTSDHRSWNTHLGIAVREYVSYRAPFWDSQGFPVLLTDLIVQTTFLAVVAAVIVNLFPHRRRK